MCAPDSVVYQLQTAYTAGITTIVFGVQTSLFDLAPGVLQAFANAGAGEATLAPVTTGGTSTTSTTSATASRGWACRSHRVRKAQRARHHARHLRDDDGADEAVHAERVQPDAAGDAALGGAVGVKSCTFDLSDVGGKSIKVDLDQA